MVANLKDSDMKKVEDARKKYNEKSINELLSDEEENKLRKEKLKKIFENEQKQIKNRK